MNRGLTCSLAFFMTMSTLAIPPRAAKKPRAVTDSRNAMVWTDDNLASLHLPGLICILGRTHEETPKSASAPAPAPQTQNPASMGR
jgi:hypothetical protein